MDVSADPIWAFIRKSLNISESVLTQCKPCGRILTGDLYEFMDHLSICHWDDEVRPMGRNSMQRFLSVRRILDRSGLTNAESVYAKEGDC